MTTIQAIERRVPIGAEWIEEARSTHFRVWAPEHRKVEIVWADRSSTTPLEQDGSGYFSGLAAGMGPGSLYRYLVDGEGPFPDPSSRFQPEGPHGFSEVIDPDHFRWSDHRWPGCQLSGQVIYEVHLGTFTQKGGWDAAAEQLPYLADTGITLIEIMPISDFPGDFGWGYDGVQPYAPASLYGRPDSMRAFVDRAHSLKIGVILDVVYNHVGPDGNYLSRFAKSYFSQRHTTDWGPALNFDGPGSCGTREFVRENAAYWIREFHLDGLRLDATQDVYDDGSPHILSEICEASRNAANGRGIVLISENEPQDTRLVDPVHDLGCGHDALWNDDFHHTATVALTGKADAYYTDYRGSAQEFVSSMKYGYLFQGQVYRWQRKRRGTPNWHPPRAAMVTFIQNHDQIANSARGERIAALTSPGRLKAVTALMLLGPGTPMLFQGQEFSSSKPFLFFADHKPELAGLVREGRAAFLAQWRSLGLSEMQAILADPCSRETFERCKLDFSEVERNAELYAMHQDLLRLRREDPIISSQGRYGLDGAVLSPQCFAIRFFSESHTDDRLLIVNLGAEQEFAPAPEPLLAPTKNKSWKVIFSTEDPQYKGSGTPPVETEDSWWIPGEAAVLLRCC